MNVNNNFTSIEQITGTYLNHQVPQKHLEIEKSFADVLSEKANESLRFSKHAGERLATRNIQLTDSQLNRLEEGARKAERKGINESLMIMDNMAFIVNVKNHTVITAMEQTESKENVFTNIDGAVII